MGKLPHLLINVLLLFGDLFVYVLYAQALRQSRGLVKIAIQGILAFLVLDGPFLFLSLVAVCRHHFLGLLHLSVSPEKLVRQPFILYYTMPCVILAKRAHIDVS